MHSFTCYESEGREPKIPLPCTCVFHRSSQDTPLSNRGRGAKTIAKLGVCHNNRRPATTLTAATTTAIKAGTRQSRSAAP